MGGKCSSEERPQMLVCKEEISTVAMMVIRWAEIRSCQGNG